MAALLHTSLRLAGAARLGGSGGGGGGGGGTLQAAGGSPRDSPVTSPVTSPAGLMMTGGMKAEVALGFWARVESIELRLLGCMAPACIALWVGTSAPTVVSSRGLVGSATVGGVPRLAPPRLAPQAARPQGPTYFHLLFTRWAPRECMTMTTTLRTWWVARSWAAGWRCGYKVVSSTCGAGGARLACSVVSREP